MHLDKDLMYRVEKEEKKRKMKKKQPKFLTLGAYLNTCSDLNHETFYRHYNDV